MADNQLVVEVRRETGKGVARRLRRAGRIPGVVYGKGRESTPIALDGNRLLRILRRSERGLNTLVEVRSEDPAFGHRTVLVKDLQRHPVRGDLLHADLYEVDLEQTVEVSVPVHLVGTARGVAVSGGIVEHTLREIEVACLPGSIPDAVEVDISGLDIGESLHVSDIPLPPGVTLRTDPSLAVVSVAAPAAEEAPAGAEAAAEEAPAEGEAAGPAPEESGSGD